MTRNEMHLKLVKMLGNNRVYYQPPETIKIDYPCIVYKKVAMPSKYADNKTYVMYTEFEVTVMTKSPDDKTAEKIIYAFEHAKFIRRFTSDNIYNDVVTIII